MAVVVNESKPTERSRWAFLFALPRESRPFQKRNPGELTFVTGIGAHRAAAATKQIIEIDKPSAIICCGFAGALRAKWSVGDVIVAREVVDETKRVWPCNAITGISRVITTSRMIADPAEKARLGELHNADAVDMESAAVAQVCCDAGVPFGCVRVISDAVNQQLSPGLAQLLNDGNLSVGKAIAALARSPSLLPEFLRLARQTSLASKKLAEALEVLRRG